MENKERLVFVDYLRVVACFLVMLVHSSENFYAADALRRTMEELREQCRMMIVRERKQACYHFTVVVCAPPNSSVTEIN